MVAGPGASGVRFFSRGFKRLSGLMGGMIPKPAEEATGLSRWPPEA
jgi:hypothetical protein